MTRNNVHECDATVYDPSWNDRGSRGKFLIAHPVAAV